MRVLIVASDLPTTTSPATGIFIAEQARSLRAAGVAVDLLSLNARATRWNYALGFPRLLKAIASNAYHVVHTHHTYSYILVDLARRMAGVRAPIVFTNHDGEVLDPTRTHRVWHPRSVFRRSLLLKRFAANRADFVIFVSRYIAAALGLGRHVRQAVIPCGVDLQKFKPLDRRACRKQLALPEDHFIVFFPAHPKARGKWFALAQAAFEIVRARIPTSVLLIGGSIPYDAMPIYYGAADVVLQSSIYEASPTIVKEALACERPLVSTDSGDTRDIVSGVPFCFVCGNSATELAERMVQCLGQWAVHGRARLLSAGLSLEQVAQRIIAVYDTIARPRKP
jgi:glycosyltransferase involved in cell wall biosynthesis